MAKSISDFKGWQYVLDVSVQDTLSPSPSPSASSPGTPSRRSSRHSKSNNASKIVLRRSSDGLELKDGDCVMIKQTSDPAEEEDIAYIKEIKFATDVYIEIIIMWFVRIEDTEYETLKKPDETINKQEIFITSVLDVIQLSTISKHAKILSEKEYSDSKISEEEKSSTFFCRRGCDSTGEVFSSDIDWRDYQINALEDQNHFLNAIRILTVPSVKSGLADPSSVKPSPKKKQTVDKVSYSEKKTRILKLDSGSSDESSDGASDFSSVSDSEDSLNSLDDENYGDAEGPKRGRGRPRLTNRPIKRIKSNMPSLPSRNLPFTETSFKEAKAKLHTSARLNSLPCREDEFTEVYLNLESAISSQSGCCLYISGTPGVGKTATVREVISQLQEISTTGDLQPFDYIEINGLKLINPHAAYEVLWEKISGNRASASQSSMNLERYFQNEGSEKKPLVILMDELDQIVTKNQNVMYNFFNWPTYEYSKLIVIAVANTMDLPERVLTNKISSRLGLRRIQFIGYTYQQLGIIIKHRLDLIEKNRENLVINEDAIEFAARKVAAVSGDARRALTICRRAVEIAEQEFLKKTEVEALNKKNDKTKKKKAAPVGEKEIYYVNIPHISKAINETTNSPMATYLKSLSFATKLFLVSILLRKKRSGLAENSLGDVLDEMKRVLTMYTSNNKDNKNVSMMDVLYGTDNSLRVFKFKFIVNELVENGLLLQQNVNSERYALLNLNISEDEIFNVLRRDQEIEGML